MPFDWRDIKLVCKKLRDHNVPNAYGEQERNALQDMVRSGELGQTIVDEYLRWRYEQLPKQERAPDAKIYQIILNGQVRRISELNEEELRTALCLQIDAMEKFVDALRTVDDCVERWRDGK